tara:strand:+ start:18 stop:1127 length:1110 start_codon:yes stop_codon:yes gene_type:complete
MSTTNYFSNSSTITTLVFSGGGTKGISFIGAIKYLEELDILKNINKYIASSIGSVIATFLCLGYNVNTIHRLIHQLDLTLLQDINLHSIMNFTCNFGIDNGNNFMKLIKIIIKKKTGNEDITLKELFHFTNKVIVITGTCLNNSSTYFFDYKKNPNMKLCEAIRISTCFPLYFHCCTYDNKIFVDGALSCYFPISICEQDEHYLGIVIDDTTHEQLDTIDDIFTFVQCLFHVNFKQYKENMIRKHKYKTIVIPMNASSIDFQLNDEEKQHFYQIGYKASEDFFLFLQKQEEEEQKLQQELKQVQKQEEEEQKLQQELKSKINNSYCELNNNGNITGETNKECENDNEDISSKNNENNEKNNDNESNTIN